MGVLLRETMWREVVVSLLGPWLVVQTAGEAAARRRRDAEPGPHYFQPLHQFPPPFFNPFLRHHLPSYPAFLPRSPPHRPFVPFHHTAVADHIHLPHVHVIHPPPSPPPPPHTHTHTDQQTARQTDRQTDRQT